MEIDGRIAETLLAGLVEWPLSVCDTESLEAFVVETDLTLGLFLGAAVVVILGSLASREEKRGVPGGVRSQS